MVPYSIPSSSTPPGPLPTHLYKILASSPFTSSPSSTQGPTSHSPSHLPQTLPLSALDSKDGFIHLSTSTQVPLTASRFFDQDDTLWLLKMRVDVFGSGSGNGEIVWEEIGGGEVFPHLYGGGLGREVVEEVLEVHKIEKGGQRKGWVEVLGDLEA